MARSNKVKLAVSGHAHWNYSVMVGGVCYLTLAALVPYAQGEDRGGSYGLLTLENDALRFEVYRCGSRERQAKVVERGESQA